jgi:predicted O-methyltransferase YrrM
VNVTADSITPGFPLADGPVLVCQLKVELEMMLDLYRRANPKRVLELGTASGGTLYHYAQNSTPGTRIVTVDLPEPAYPTNEHLYPEWTPDGVSIHPIRGDTRDASIVEACKLLGPYDWLLIDASHVLDDVLSDYNNYAPIVRPGGLVLLHDIALVRDYGDGTYAGVGEVWRLIQAQGHWTRELRAAPNLNGYGIGVQRV